MQAGLYVLGVLFHRGIGISFEPVAAAEGIHSPSDSLRHGQISSGFLEMFSTVIR